MSGRSLVVENLDVRYGPVHAVRGLSLQVEPGEIVGPDRRERRRQVIDAARDHGRRAGDRRRCPAWRRVAPRPRARGCRAQRRRARPGRAPRLRGAHGRGESAARARRATHARAMCLPCCAASTTCSRSWRSSGAATRVCSPVVSSNSSRSPARSSPSLTCCSSTSRRSAWRRRWSTSSSARSPRFATRASRCSLVEQRAQRTVALANRSHVLANGELRVTLGPEQAGDIETLVAAYLS